MSNHCFATVRCRAPSELFRAFADGVVGASVRFPKAFEILSRDETSIEVALIDPVHGQLACRAGFWQSGGRKVEWRHPRDVFLTWWFQETVASIAARKARQVLNCTVTLTDEGIDGPLGGEFDQRYPRLSDWVKAMSMGFHPAGTYSSEESARSLLSPQWAALEAILESPPIQGTEVP